ncbi:hypothetical protein BC936DRAFT_140649 [Jimgerdemannia flammicorona]|uniref:F-box/LRR-repeat protein 15-like leucin rich repeat domain-containing protein n=1 Tax=Jimgerdemannia flammicorona TaxID=994334 RepID=A0A433AH10_9FUNG|nr:hypothetical protein BC936DRAFT_140649 [Jimgerdemannia flammicorona]
MAALLEIDLTSCPLITNSSIPSVFKHCGQLREFRLGSCSSLTDTAFVEGIRATHYDQLRILDLTAVSLVTDLTLQTIVHAAPKLRNLVLAKCVNITDEGVLAVCHLGRHLHYLHLGHCSQITDQSVIQLARVCTRLRYLDLACCTQLTDRSVVELANLQKLKRIGLVKCSNITDGAIYALIDHRAVSCTLERVHLSYCVNLTIRAVAELVNFCNRLTHLSLTGVPAFLRQDLQQFCRQPPREFTPQQRQVFCVFSGKGVRELRTYFAQYAVAAAAVADAVADDPLGLMAGGGLGPAAMAGQLALMHHDTEDAAEEENEGVMGGDGEGDEDGDAGRSEGQGGDDMEL